MRYMASENLEIYVTLKTILVFKNELNFALAVPKQYWAFLCAHLIPWKKGLH